MDSLAVLRLPFNLDWNVDLFESSKNSILEFPYPPSRPMVKHQGCLPLKTAISEFHDKPTPSSGNERQSKTDCQEAERNHGNDTTLFSVPGIHHPVSGHSPNDY